MLIPKKYLILSYFFGVPVLTQHISEEFLELGYVVVSKKPSRDIPAIRAETPHPPAHSLGDNIEDREREEHSFEHKFRF